MRKRKWWWLPFLLIFCVVPRVSAGYQDTKITRKLIPRVFSNVVINGRTYWSQMGYAYTNGVVAYCIEPEIGLSDFLYDSYLDFNIAGLTMQQKQQMELIAEYGYQYQNHQTDRYYMATQELIWEVLGYQQIYFTTASQTQGMRIDVSHEKQEISRLMIEDWKTPQFTKNEWKGTVGETLVLEDQNHVLSNYDVESSSNLKVTSMGNQLDIELLEVGTGKIELSRKVEPTKNSFIYKKSGSQSLASFSLSASLKSHITVEIEGGKISLEKIDMDTLSSEPRGEAALTGAVYEIKDENGKIVDTLVTDSEGKAMSKMLPFGRYTVKETIPSTGYLLDEKIYTVELQKSSQENITVVSSKEKVIEHEIAFMKVYNDGNTGIMKPEMQITFDIYDKDDNKVSTVTTNKEGYVSLKLPYGTYTVRQQNTSPYYEKVSDFKLYVYEDKKEVVNYVLSDALVKAKLKVIKMDAETKEKIQVSGVKFKIKNLETGEYVKQEVTYPKKEIVDTFQTDETGEFMTPNFLMGGRYQLEEIVAPSGYLISHPIPFTIDHIYMSGENVVEVVVEDSKPKAKLEIVKTGDKISYQKGIHQLKSIYEKVPLAGATFQVLANEEIQNQDHIYQKGDIIEEIVTDQAGHAESSLLPLGSYCIKETLAPLGYKKEDQLQCVEVKFKDQITPVIIETLKVHNIRERNQYFFQKLGQVFVGLEQNEGVYQNVSLSDVTFGLYTKDHMNFGEIFVDSDTLIEKIVTDEKGIGHIKTELPDGRYYLKELDVPNLYEKNSQIYEFTLNETTKHQEEVLREPIVNKIKKGTLELEKQDKETSQILYGAEFEFQYENLSPIPLTLDQGNIILKNVPYGTYTFRETKAPNYYRKSLDQQKILLEEDHRKIIFYNDRVIVPKTSNTMRYFRLTIFTLCGFGFMLVIGSRWVAKRQGLY